MAAELAIALRDLDPARGRRLLVTYLRASDWFHRRVELIEMLSDEEVRRRVSCDLSLPADPPAQWPYISQFEVVPLTLLAKRPLVAFDLRDEADQPLPLLTTPQNTLLGVEMLVAQAEVELGDHVPHDVLCSLVSIVGSEADSARASAGVFGKLECSRSARERLLQSDVFGDILNELALNFMLLALVPHSGGRRAMVKYSYREPLKVERRDVFAQLAWRPSKFAFDLPMVGYPASYHVEIDVPEGLTGTAAGVVDAQDEVVPSRTSLAGSRMHLQIPGEAPLGARAIADLAVERRGFLRASVVTTAGTSALLLLVALRDEHISEDNYDAVSALLGLLPSAAAAYLTRPGEHGIASSLLFSARVVVLGVAASALAAAGAVATAVDARALELLLWLAVAWSCLSTAVLFIALRVAPDQ